MEFLRSWQIRRSRQFRIADDAESRQLAGKVLTIGGKKYYEFTTPHFSTFALVDADELGLEVKEEAQVDAKALTAKLTPVARSAKTAKKNVKVTVRLDKQDKAIIKTKDAGYTVKYRYRSKPKRKPQATRPSSRKDRFLHQYRRQKRHEVLLQGSGQSLRCGRQACRENRTQAVQVRKQNLDEREIKSGSQLKSGKPDHPDT